MGSRVHHYLAGMNIHIDGFDTFSLQKVASFFKHPLSRFTYTAFINRVLRRESGSIICHPVRLFQPSTTTAPSFIREINNVTRNIVE